MSPHTNPKPTSAKTVAGSLLAGVAAAFALVVGPFGGAGEASITGAILLGFAAGWALLAGLSTRRDDGSHAWASVPAVTLGASGTALAVVRPGTETLDALGWVWPPLLLALVIWMTAQARRQPKARLFYPVFAVMALSAIGGGYETVQLASAGGAVRLPGDRLVDVGGHKLNIRCIGSGTPTVVVEAGLGEFSSAISRWIAPTVAHTTRVCVYDRAGHGRSDVAPDADAARDLHILLERAGERGPFVMAGHSLGGMYVLSYVHRYPSDVSGVVLLDSMYPKQNATVANMASVIGVLPTLARTGLARLLTDPSDGQPTAQARQFARDVEQMPAELNRAAQLTTLGDRPLGVVTAAKGSQPGWAAHQVDLADLSTHSFHRTVAGSTHQSLIDDRQDAVASSRAIHDVVVAVRRGQARDPRS